MIAEPETFTTILDDLLAEQQRLTAVERFARQHERGGLPAQARYYQALIPLHRPERGEQYAFAVDLDLCTSCKGCVSACHSLNGLDEDELWRNVGLIHGGTTESAYQQTITTACHHCVDPACLNGCPVLAYEKDEATGIVRHLDDQCIGCQYCVLKCPYDVPKYSKKRGIVRKCDMCYHRLTADEAPACVQACPTGAIAIRIVSKEAITALTEPGDRLVPGAFSSAYTKPTTLYTTRKPVPANAQPADAPRLRLEHAHWPLIWMLVLTQVAAGLLVAASGLSFFQPTLFARVGGALSLTGFVVLQVGLASSILHLGRPWGAWRALLGLRRSWMSREIVAFGFLAGCAALFTGAAHWPFLVTHLSSLHLVEKWVRPASWTSALGVLTSVASLASVACSAMIYVDTQRPFWMARLTMLKFFGTMLVFGCWALASCGIANALPLAALGLTALGFWEWKILSGARAMPDSGLHRPALVHQRLLGGVMRARHVLIVCVWTAAACTALAPHSAEAWLSAALLLFAFAAQMAERYCFFTASCAPRMPGRIGSN